MRRLRQQTWFCIAAAFLAMTLSAVWTQDVKLAAEDLPASGQSDRGTVIRRRQDLNPAVTEIQNGPVLRPQSSRPAAIQPKTLENGPLLVPDSVVPLGDGAALPSLSPDSDRDIERTGYLGDDHAGQKQAVWFRGSIEPAP